MFFLVLTHSDSSWYIWIWPGKRTWFRAWSKPATLGLMVPTLTFSINDDTAVGKKCYATCDTEFRDAVWGEKTHGWVASAHCLNGMDSYSPCWRREDGLVCWWWWCEEDNNVGAFVSCSLIQIWWVYFYHGHGADFWLIRRQLVVSSRYMVSYSWILMDSRVQLNNYDHLHAVCVKMNERKRSQQLVPELCTRSSARDWHQWFSLPAHVLDSGMST